MNDTYKINTNRNGLKYKNKQIQLPASKHMFSKSNDVKDTTKW